MNILMIAYYYPPKGGGGVQRTLKFVKHLSRMGHTVHVLTVKEATEDIEDSSFFHNMNNIYVHRTDIKEIHSVNWLLKKGAKSGISQNRASNKVGFKSGIRRTAKSLILNLINMRYIPDDKCGWINYAVKEGLNIIEDNKIDVIYSTSSPYSAHLIGYELADKSKIRWIADFRDPWASNQFINFNYIIKRKHKSLEAKVVNKADKVVSVSEPIINDFRMQYKNENKNKFVVIPNGYDEEDFIDLDLKASELNDRFTIVYNGMIYGKRSPEKVLMAIDNLIKKNKIDVNKVEILFHGKIGNEHIGIIKHYEDLYPEVIKHCGQTTHRESLQELCRANALLLLIDEGPGSSGIYTGKIFEYIRTGKIILGVVPDGVAKNLIADTKTGYTAYPSRIDEIEGIIFKAYIEFINNNKDFKPDYNKIQHYSRENLTKKLIEVMSI